MEMHTLPVLVNLLPHPRLQEVLSAGYSKPGDERGGDGEEGKGKRKKT